MTAKKIEDDAVERFISGWSWYWDEKTRNCARDLCAFLFEFIDDLKQQGLSEKTIQKHINNCWSIGWLECQYGYRDKFSPEKMFYDEEASHEYEFERKISDSKYAIGSYRTTWRKIYKYAKKRGLVD